jgi:hypothetical protein
MKNLLIFFGIAPLLLGVGCSEDPNNANVSANVIKEDNKIFIVDRTGKRWDVTHAENHYGLKAERFQFGLGPNAIPPILNPEFLSPGEVGYPASDQTFLVIGTALNNDPRAYAISDLIRHEVAEELFDSTYVAVAY